jgi:hypothetical protein
MPSEVVQLPSKGLLYPKENPLSSGQVEMKYMTAKEEDILTNIALVKANTVLDRLLQSLITTPINYDDLLLLDKEALLIAARILGYGKDYTFTFANPETGGVEEVTVDLTTLKEREFDESLIKPGTVNEFEFTLPVSKNVVTFKFLSIKDEKEIKKELEGLKKASPNSSYEITTRLKRVLTSVNGDRTLETVRGFADVILAPDSRALRKYITDIQPGQILKFNYESETYAEEGVDLPITSSFFWPEG